MSEHENAPPSAPRPVGEAIDLAALRDARDEHGRFKTGSPGPAFRHGLRSALLIEQPELATAYRERVAAIDADLGGELSTVKRSLVSEHARLQLITDSLGADILARGALTGKGRTRAAVTVYLAVLDRQVRLAQLLGLEKRTKPVMDLETFMRAHTEEDGQ